MSTSFTEITTTRDDTWAAGCVGTKTIEIEIEQCFTSPPTQYRLYERRFLQVKRPNQQYHSTEGTNSTQKNQTYNKET